MNSRPKVSVCLAAYQGSRYIGIQLRSILPQLHNGDEIVCVDDGSTDNTRDEISYLQDPRIVLISNSTNQGLLRSFETSVSRATGEIIFLSDQDDVWMPHKVETVLAAFARDPQLTMTVSDAILIDQNGARLADSYYRIRGRFREGLVSNLLICRFLGCTMAFRSALLRRALPFPRSSLIHHDLWLGCVNTIVGGKTVFIPEPLMAYRQHSGSATAARLSNSRRLRMRLQLSLALLRLGVSSLVR